MLLFDKLVADSFKINFATKFISYFVCLFVLVVYYLNHLFGKLFVLSCFFPNYVKVFVFSCGTQSFYQTIFLILCQAC